MDNAIATCPFCLENKLLSGPILAESTGAYLIESRSSPGRFLVIPKQHTTLLADLPDTWWRDFKLLLGQLPAIPEAFNITLNFGTLAGQTVEHLHFWIIPRQADLPSSGKGLARLIYELDRS